MAEEAKEARDNSIKVVCRFRPLNKIELQKNSKYCTVFDESRPDLVTLRPSDGTVYDFVFDRVFNAKTTQIEVYNYAARPIVEDVLKGYNGCLLAYGQTGAGKTHTMTGPSFEDEEMKGIIPRVVDAVFRFATDAPESLEFAIKVSFVEIYLEKIRDLLDTSKSNLQVGEDPVTGVFIKDVTEVYVTSEQEMIAAMRLGDSNRVVAATGMNEGSSRSHSLFIITIEQKNTEDGTVTMGRLYLVDLAGSETVGKTGVTGQQLEEAKKINKSLSALGNVINALTDGKSSHVPYRDSKLTRVLQESLGGNSKTALIINCSPSTYNEAETLSTLRFGKRAKSITNQAKVNQALSKDEMARTIARLEGIVRDLQAQLAAATANGGPRKAMPAVVEENDSDEDTPSQPAVDTAAMTAKFAELESKNAHLIDANNKLQAHVQSLTSLLQEAMTELDTKTEELEAMQETLVSPGRASQVSDAQPDDVEVSVVEDGQPAQASAPSATSAVDAADADGAAQESPATPPSKSVISDAPLAALMRRERGLSAPEAMELVESIAAGEESVRTAELRAQVEDLQRLRDSLTARAEAAELELAKVKMAALGTPSNELRSPAPPPRAVPELPANMLSSPGGTVALPEDEGQIPTVSNKYPIPSMQVECEFWENQRKVFLLGWSDKSERYHFSNAAGDREVLRDHFVLPSKEWCWLGNWAIDKRGDVDGEGWAYGGNWANLTVQRAGGHAVPQSNDAVRRRRWVRVRTRIALEGAGEATNQLLAMNFTVQALETVNRKLGDQVFQQQQLIVDYEDRVNALLARLAAAESHANSVGTSFKRTLHGRGGVVKPEPPTPARTVSHAPSSSMGGELVSTPASGAATAAAVSNNAAAPAAAVGSPAGTMSSPKPAATPSFESPIKRPVKGQVSLDAATREWMEAAEKGDTTKLIAIANSGTFDINALDADSRNAAHCAARGGHVHALECLAGCGVEISAFDRNGRTPLHYAARYGHVDVVEWLVTVAHLDVGGIDQHAITPLHQAALGGHKPVCLWLLEHGAELDARDSSGLTASRLAQSMKKVDVVEFLAAWKEDEERRQRSLASMSQNEDAMT